MFVRLSAVMKTRNSEPRDFGKPTLCFLRSTKSLFSDTSVAVHRPRRQQLRDRPKTNGNSDFSVLEVTRDLNFVVSREWCLMVARMESKESFSRDLRACRHVGGLDEFDVKPNSEQHFS